MQHLIDYLANCPSQLHNYFSSKTYSPLETILTQGEPAYYAYILIEGQAKVSSMTLDGMKYIEYIYNPGELFGEIELLNHKPILSSVEALTHCKTIQIPGEHFKKWLLLDPQFALYISTQLASKLYQSSLHAQTNIAYSLRHRILYFLHYYSSQNTMKGIPKNLIVESVLSNIRSVNRILKQLSDEGLVIVKNGIVWLNTPS